MLDKFVEWCRSDTALAKCTRTVFQGVIGAVVAYAPDLIAGAEVIPAEWKPLVLALVMAFLAPVQAQIGGVDHVEDEGGENV